MRPCRLLKVSVTFVALAGAALYAQAPNSEVTPEVEKALLDANWAKVGELLAKVNPNTLPTVPRLIKGHACLALNRNNESMELFASTLNDPDRREWQAWANSLAKMHPQQALAWYCKGDSKARMKEWAAAEECFSKALALDANCALAWNARGVVAHAAGNTLQARTYFLRATKAREDFADAYTSRGTLNVYLNSATAQASFEEARRTTRDANPKLVTMGLGCVHYGRGEYAAARNLFEALVLDANLYALAEHNAAMTELALLGGALRKAARVGTSLERIELRNDNGRTIGLLTRADRLSGDLPEGTIIVITGPDGTEYIVWIEPLGKNNEVSGGNAPRIDQPPLSERASGAEYTISPELFPALPSLPPGIVASTTGPGKRGGRGGGITWPPSWRRPVPPGGGQPAPGPHPGSGPKPGPRPTKRATLASVIAMLYVEVTGRIVIATTTPASSSEAKALPPGGADSDVGGVRVNTGNWGVLNVYGLLYPIENSDNVATRQ